MTIEGIISQLWAQSVPLCALVPATSIYTGKPPLRDANGELIPMPFVGLTSSVDETERTSEGMFYYGPVDFLVVSQSYDNARKIAHAVAAYFNRADAVVGKVRLLDMRVGPRNDTEDAEDSVWEVKQGFMARYYEANSRVVA